MRFCAKISLILLSKNVYLLKAIIGLSKRGLQVSQLHILIVHFKRVLYKYVILECAYQDAQSDLGY